MNDELLRIGSEAHYEDSRLYDHIYRRRSEDVRYYADLAESLAGPVLELGVGTGRVACAIARRGIDVVGVDRMPSMLSRARERREKLPRRAGSIELRRGDLRRVRLDRRFPLVIAPFNVLMHLYERRDVEAALRVVRRHLTRGGRFAFDVLLPDPDSLARDPMRIYRVGRVTDPRDGRRYRYRENFRYDAARQVQVITMSYQAEDDPRVLSTTPLAHRQFFPAELEALLHYNGFAIERHDGGFSGERLTGESESQVVVARVRGSRR